jgi:hypothetical protein
MTCPRCGDLTGAKWCPNCGAWMLDRGPTASELHSRRGGQAAALRRSRANLRRGVDKSVTIPLHTPSMNPVAIPPSESAPSVAGCYSGADCDGEAAQAARERGA